MAKFSGAPLQTGVGGGVFSGVTIIGIQELAAKLALINRIAHAEMGLLTKGAADHMMNAAKENVPKITHNLESGINVEKGVGTYQWEVTASSMAGDKPEKNKKEYAGFVEFGTSKMAPRYYMTTAFAETAPIVQADLLLIAAKLMKL